MVTFNILFEDLTFVDDLKKRSRNLFEKRREKTYYTLINKSVYIQISVMFVIFMHVSYIFWALNQNILVILRHQLLLCLIRNTILNVICVFTFILLQVGQQRPLGD